MVSGVPAAGSLLVVTAWLLWLRGADSRPLDVVTWLLVLIGTGGIHWLLLVMFAQWIQCRGRTST